MCKVGLTLVHVFEPGVGEVLESLVTESTRIVEGLWLVFRVQLCAQHVYSFRLKLVCHGCTAAVR